ncbi:hypothetical protein N7509_000385 [Penicillium cosmopolitanum]|uniref:Uncharacterized protein n=1 Tax=Penicillium cosmopolitanum TaxID=1131564 RepID=A0A9W9WAG8_9EURO|nr:uncharacterized protein N7509_000385 [Penicillium cosmopolitanum]XP_057118454.1 uncharacterized protein N7481_008558 [Penicillium waksmanii]KAJ5413758.1 hypothetical protein N7509_000385 [Penicillium cosmopolitanum]KAJ5974851.1 hypothetical protein N7481_008558 [Penicillium waksmanii]
MELLHTTTQYYQTRLVAELPDLARNAVRNFLVDVYLITASAITRSVRGSAATLLTDHTFSAMGAEGGESLIGRVAALMVVIQFPTSPSSPEKTDEAGPGGGSIQSSESLSFSSSTGKEMVEEPEGDKGTS